MGYVKGAALILVLLFSYNFLTTSDFVGSWWGVLIAIPAAIALVIVLAHLIGGALTRGRRIDR